MKALADDNAIMSTAAAAQKCAHFLDTLEDYAEKLAMRKGAQMPRLHITSFVSVAWASNSISSSTLLLASHSGSTALGALSRLLLPFNVDTDSGDQANSAVDAPLGSNQLDGLMSDSERQAPEPLSSEWIVDISITPKRYVYID